MDTPHAFLDALDEGRGWETMVERVAEEPEEEHVVVHSNRLPSIRSQKKSVSFADDIKCSEIVMSSGSGGSAQCSGMTNSSQNSGNGTSYGIFMEPGQRRALSGAFIEDSLKSLPIKPDKVSNIQGPFVDLHQVDHSTIDVEVTHQFRAHFDSQAVNSTSLAALPPAKPYIEEVNDARSHDGTAPNGAPMPYRVPVASPRSSNETHSGPASSTKDYDIHAFDMSLAHMNAANGPRRVASEQARHTPSPWEIDPAEVVIGERLAVGGFAEVFVGKYQGTLIAIKLLLNVDELGKERFMREVALLASLRHPNLILFMGYATQPHLAIVSEFMHRGSLFKVLRKGGDKPLDLRLQRSVAISVARGMAYLHSRSPPLLHLDLKSPNILIDDKWRVKVADFGLSRVMHSTYMSAGAGAGTPEWMAPEVLRSEKHDEKADVYSYGVVLWECLTGQVPWENMHPMQVVGAVGFQGKTLELPEKGDKFLIGLCKRCMSSKPYDRPTFHQVVQELEQNYAPGQVTSMSHTLSQSSMRLKERGSRRTVEQGMARSLPAHYEHTSGSDKSAGHVRLSDNMSDHAAVHSASSNESMDVRVPKPATSSDESACVKMASSELDRSIDTDIQEPAPSVQVMVPVMERLHTARSLSNASPFAQLEPFSDEESDEAEDAVPAESAGSGKGDGYGSVPPSLDGLILTEGDGPPQPGSRTQLGHRLASLDTECGASRGYIFEVGLHKDSSMQEEDVGSEGSGKHHSSDLSHVNRLSATTAGSCEVPSFTSSLEAAAWDAAKKAAAGGDGAGDHEKPGQAGKVPSMADLYASLDSAGL